MDDVAIRAAVMADRHILEDLQRRASLNNPGDREALLANPDAIEIPPVQIAAGQVFVAERDGAIIGFSAVLLRQDLDTDLDGLFVEPALWGQGIGRLLVEYCVAFARARGSAALHVVGNPHAEGFYRSCDFQLIGPAHTRFGPASSYRRSLPSP
jgi:GNAT superfamily N-acetyltransferase